MPDRAGKEPRCAAKRLYSPEYCPPEYTAQEKKDQTKAGVEDLKKEEIEIETQVLQIRKEKEETKQELERSFSRIWKVRKRTESRLTKDKKARR